MAQALDKYRINPGNVGTGRRRDEQFATICAVARENGKARADRCQRRLPEPGARHGEDAGEHRQGPREDLRRRSSNECMVLSALQSTELALECGLGKDQIVISCKVSRPRELISLYRDLAARTDQPLHLGLTEAGMGTKGLVWSSAAMGVLLAEGIGDTIRVSLTPRPGGDRREEVYAACELLQSLGLRSVRAERHGLPRLRPDDLVDVPGAGRADPGLRAREDAGLEGRARGRRDDDARRHGLHRERPGRVEGGEHRDQPPGHRRGAELPRLRRRAEVHDAQGHRTRSSRPPSGRSSTTTSRRSTRGGHRRAGGRKTNREPDWVERDNLRTR